MSRLITPSLISSISWFKNCPPTWKGKAIVDLKNQLGRVYSEPTPALTLGIKFEDAVVKATSKPADEVQGSEHFKWIVDEVRGGEFQRRTAIDLNIDGQDYCLYGKIDAYFPTIIKDIKTTSNWKGPQGYLDSFQHRMYCFNEQVECFRYLVATFDEQQHITGHYSVDVDLPDRLSLEAEIVHAVKEAITFLSASTELFNLYITRFCKK
jgi:hypothetical protein